MKKKIICFGEVLWDMLPEGKVLGGAPLNVLYHAIQQGLEGNMITAIGKDELGTQIKKRCEELGLSIDLVQEYENFETGIAAVSLDENGSASYELVKPVAYDNILEENAQQQYLQECDVFVFGSLANRDEATRNTLIKLLDKQKVKTDCTIVFDINLRAPHYHMDVISELMSYANIVKLNDDELVEVAAHLDLSGEPNELMLGLINKFSLDAMVCTRGANGAIYVDKNQEAEIPGKKIVLVDTVGSGDAFLAAFISSYLQQDPIDIILKKANELGAFVASNRGAIVSY